MVYTSPHGEISGLYKAALSHPHLLIAGVTGSGKSVAINGLISTLLYRFPGVQPGGAYMILIDPKMVELAAYKDLPHTLAHARGYSPAAWTKALDFATKIMESRFREMEARRERIFTGGDVYVIIDEWAIVSRAGGRAVYDSVLRLSSEGRAAHVHLILATQFPTAKILPTEIRGNFDWRIALRTNTASESRIVIGRSGCEKLPDYGYGYYYTHGKNNCTLVQIPMVIDAEIDRLVSHWERQAS